MTPTNRAILFWLIRVSLAILLVFALEAYRGPNPTLWYLAAGYVVLSAFMTFLMTRRGK